MPPLLEAAAGYGCSMRTSLESAEFGSGFAAAPPSRQARDGYVNPVLDADLTDPAVIHAPDGYFYAYATQTMVDDKWINLQVARSADLVRWEHLGDALPAKPAWAGRRPRISGRRTWQRDGGALISGIIPPSRTPR